MAVTMGRTDSGALGKVGSSQAFAVGFRKMVKGSVDAAGSIADIWDTGKGGMKNVEVVLFSGAGIADLSAKTVAGGVYPQTFVAFGH